MSGHVLSWPVFALKIASSCVGSGL